MSRIGSKKKQKNAGERQLGFVYRLKPDMSQREAITPYFSACRVVWNLLLAEKQAEYKSWKSLSPEERVGFHWLTGFDMIKLLPKWKQIEEFAWISVASGQALQNVAKNLADAFNLWLKGVVEHPKRKTRRRSRYSFTDDRIKLKDGKLQIPLIWKKVGLIDVVVDREIPAGAKVSGITVSCRGNPHWKGSEWFVSLKVTLPAGQEKAPKTGKSVGIDVGLKDFAVLSNGKKVKRHRFEKKARRKEAHLQRIQSRKYEAKKRRQKALQTKLAVEGIPEKERKKQYVSRKNYDKINGRLAKARYHVRRQRTDFLHKLTKQIVQEYDFIAVEDLRVRNMMRNHRLARSIADVGWYEFKRQLAYKSKWHGKTFIAVPPAYTSQTCSVCGAKKTVKLMLEEREWTCESCGTHHDRDVNAAKNILARGVALFESAQAAQNVQNEQQGNDVSVASSGEGDYTSGGAVLCLMAPANEVLSSDVVC